MSTVWKLVQEEYLYSAIRDQYFGDQLNHGNIHKANNRNSQIHMFRTGFFKKNQVKIIMIMVMIIFFIIIKWKQPKFIFVIIIIIIKWK